MGRVENPLKGPDNVERPASDKVDQPGFSEKTLGGLKAAQLRTQYARHFSPSKVWGRVAEALYADTLKIRVVSLHLNVPNPHEEDFLDDWEESVFDNLPGLKTTKMSPHDANSEFVTFEAETLDHPRDVQLRLERQFGSPIQVRVLSDRRPMEGETGLFGNRMEKASNQWGPWITWARRSPLDTPQDVLIHDTVQADMVIRPQFACRTNKPGYLNAHEFMVKDFTPWLIAPPECSDEDTHTIVRYRVWESAVSHEDQEALELLAMPFDAQNPYVTNKLSEI